MLVNARHVKKVPGRKTDISDCAWLAQLLECGLLKASFVPPRPQRELRDLTRQRTQMQGDRARVVNRIQKTLEDANIKLASVATDITAKSARPLHPPPRHRSWWRGSCRPNHEWGGKRKSRRVTKANKWLKSPRTQAAGAASRTRRSYFSAQHRRLTTRRGIKRANIAVAHSLLVVAHCLPGDRAHHTALRPG